jgi:hypothetical protein
VALRFWQDHTVLQADFERSSTDAVKIQTADGVIDDRCHVLVNGTGYLNSWKCTFRLIQSHDQLID